MPVVAFVKQNLVILAQLAIIRFAQVLSQQDQMIDQ